MQIVYFLERFSYVPW